MRAVVLAYSDLGCVSLQALLDLGVDVAAVFTHADAPGESIWFGSVARLAAARGLPVFTDAPLDTPAWLDRLRGWAPDFLFSFYYRRLLPVAVLETARRGALNMHGSLLPKYRGRCPTNWVLIHDERETGVTLHYMVARADAGDIVARRRVPIDDDDTALTVYRKQCAAAGALLREVVPQLDAGTAPRLPNDLAAGSYFGGRKPADGAIDWSAAARAIFNLVRAVTHPYPGAFAQWQGRPLLVWQARLRDGGAAAQPTGLEAHATGAGARPAGMEGCAAGTVVAIDEDAMVVQTGSGMLRLLGVQWADEPEMTGGAWARVHGVTKGAVLA
jgi:UDP-4-amino-4-deoxy-L-arabinose formyltransferase/UDP-glucuronic acid dehydrogenase (UDP-4-keto-hexauronic acid decarboxylating)